MNQHKYLKINGIYRDIITRKTKVIKDTGWKSNKIVPNYGIFLAVLMKKDFNEDSLQLGIDFIAVGQGSNQDPDIFKIHIIEWLDQNNPLPLIKENYWIWVKRVDPLTIQYLDTTPVVNDKTNKLKVEIIFEEKEPGDNTFEFKEFSLFGIERKSSGEYIRNVDGTYNMFMINYVDHGLITKDNKMILTRNIQLEFPII